MRVRGTNIDIACLVNLWKFIEEECIAKLCSVKRARALNPKHFQMVVKGNITRFVVLNKKVKGLFGVGCESFDGSIVSCKKLRDEVCIPSRVWWDIV